MNPIASVVLAAGAGLGLWEGYKWIKKPRAVSTLVKGTTYGVLVNLKGIGSSDITAAAKFLSDYFMSVGFDVLSTPTLRSPEDSSAFVGNQPSNWIFNARWTVDAPYVAGSGSPNINGATFTPLPLA